MIYHLAEFNFISFLGASSPNDLAYHYLYGIVYSLPVIFNCYKDALAIDLGILAVMILFFSPSIFFGYTFNFGFSGLFQENTLLFTAVYYALISAPSSRFFNTIGSIVTSSLGLTGGMHLVQAPPLFIPLNSILYTT